MTFVPRSRFAGLPALPALAVLAAAVALGTGCDDLHIGRVCDLNAGNADAGASGSNNATVNAEALECSTRICLEPANETGTNTQALCSAGCSTDDDCSPSEKRSAGSGTDHRCQKGFKCMIPVTIGDFCCRKLCVCKDFLASPNDPFTEPTACLRSNGSTCKNAQ